MKEILEEKEYLTLFTDITKNIICNILSVASSREDALVNSIDKLNYDNEKFLFTVI